MPTPRTLGRHPQAARTGIDGTPDYVLDAERWLVGAALLAAPDSVRAAGQLVSDADFYDRGLGRIFGCAVHLVDMDKEPSAATVSYVLDELGQLDDLGGEPYLVHLCTDTFAMAYAHESAMVAHARIVHEYGQRRREGTARLAEAQRLAKEAGDIVRGAGRVKPAALYDRAEYAGELDAT